MSLTPVESVRLMVGDFDTEFQVLADSDYEHLLDKYDGSERRAALDAARAIMFYLARWPTRERTGSIEVWNEWANAYKRALESFINNPEFNVPSALAYAGGISKSDMKANDANNDNVQAPIYKGIGSGTRPYNQDNSTADDASYYGY